MKVNNPLSGILDSKVKIECLRHLCNYPTELNGRQLSRFLRITPKSIHKAMGSLVDEGVVDLSPHGNSFGYSINRDKWINRQLLLPLFQKEKSLLEVISQDIRKELKSSPLIKHIISVCFIRKCHHKKEDNSRSDFDLLILVDKESSVLAVEEKIEKVGSVFIKAYGIVFRAVCEKRCFI